MYASPRERTASALAAFGIVTLLALVLVFGLRVAATARSSAALISVLIGPPEPPKPPPPPQKKREVLKAHDGGAKGAPSPRNLRSQATPVFAPKLPPLIVPPPIVTATQPALGSAAQTGASDRAGPGQGAGGAGNGTGGGGSGGNGEGDGGIATGPRQTKGKLSFKDLPDGLIQPGGEAHVGVRYAVEPDGTVSECQADQPSGIPALDVLACRLIEERFRFKPARDRSGHPVRAIIVETHGWFIREKEDRPNG